MTELNAPPAGGVVTAPKVTAFVETAALWAVMNDDKRDARRLVDDMLPNERAAQLRQLLGMLGDYCDQCQRRVEGPGDLVTLVWDLGGLRKSVCRACAGLTVDEAVAS